MKYFHQQLWLVILLSIPLSITSAFWYDTAEPIALQSPSQLKKVADKLLLTARTINYSNQLPIDGVTIQLKSNSKLEVFFKFKNVSEEWSDWLPAKLFEEPFTDRWIATNIEDIAKESIQFELKILSKVSGYSEILNIGVLPTDTEVYSDEILSKQKVFPTDIPKPTIITRSEWGARNLSGSYYNMPYYTKLTIHHSAGYGPKTLEEGIATVKWIQDFHIDGRGWLDIGYHFLIDKAGNIFQGRPETVVGAHVGGYNTGNIGVCIMGCYHPPYTAYPCNEVLTKESRAAAVHLYAWLAEQYGYGNADVLMGHRDYPSSTSCPGDNIHQLLPEIRNEINNYIKLGGSPFDFAISDNYPNPFNGTTKIDYDLPVESDVAITIYNLKGQEVIQLANVLQPKGEYSVSWDGKNSSGALVYTGIYFYQIRIHQKVTVELDEWFDETGKMLLLR